MRLFSVSRFLVFVARLHAAEIGPDRPVAPKPVTFRITPEAAEHVTAFIDRPEFVQVHAHQKDKAGAEGPLMELLLRDVRAIGGGRVLKVLRFYKPVFK